MNWRCGETDGLMPSSEFQSGYVIIIKAFGYRLRHLTNCSYDLLLFTGSLSMNVILLISFSTCNGPVYLNYTLWLLAFP